MQCMKRDSVTQLGIGGSAKYLDTGVERLFARTVIFHDCVAVIRAPTSTLRVEQLLPSFRIVFHFLLL